jgi:hypothetical protein
MFGGIPDRTALYYCKREGPKGGEQQALLLLLLLKGRK